MQDREIAKGFVALSVPTEVITEADIDPEKDILQMTAEKGKITVTKAEDVSGFICDGDCDNCPVNRTECDGNCESCPCCE